MNVEVDHETGCERKASAEQFEHHDPNADNTLDSILLRIGEFGRYQMFNYVLLCIPMIFNAFQSISYVFTASPVVYRCNVTQCDSPTSQYWEPWVNFTIPLKDKNLDQCNRYAFDKLLPDRSSLPSSYDCVEENFSKLHVEKCSNNYKFRDAEYTVANEVNQFLKISENPTSQYWEPWVNFTIPLKDKNLDQCNRYAFDKLLPDRSSLPSSYDCVEENFSKLHVEKCSNNYKFRDAEYTVANEFEFFCSDEWKLNMAGTINNVGQFIGIPLGGLLADRFGRRTMLAIAGFLSSIMGIIRSFSTNYYMFLSFELLDMVVGSTLFPTAFLLAIELVGPKRRVAAATIITIFYSLGEALLGVLAGQFQNWRVLLRVLYIPAALHIFFLILLPESVRWLLSQGQEDKAIAVLKKAARINRKVIPESSLQNLVNSNKVKLELANESHYPIWLAIKTFFWRISNCSLCWFTHTLVALGLSLNSVNLGGNKYNTFMLNGLVQVPGLILPLFIMNSIGRRFSLCGSMLVCALCMTATIFFGKNGHAIELTLFLIGKFAITCSFQVLYFFTSEIFPTNVRNSLLSLCSMIGRIGSMLAPQTPLLANYYEYAPQMLFAGFALISGCLTLLFPETANKSLPTTMEDARNLKNNSDDKEEDDLL